MPKALTVVLKKLILMSRFRHHCKLSGLLISGMKTARTTVNLCNSLSAKLQDVDMTHLNKFHSISCKQVTLSLC